MSVLDNLQRLAKAMPERFECNIGEEYGHYFCDSGRIISDCFGHIPVGYVVELCDEFGLYDFSDYSGSLAERMLAALADKVEGRPKPTVMPEWLDKQISHVEKTVAEWPEHKRQAARLIDKEEGKVTDQERAMKAAAWLRGQSYSAALRTSGWVVIRVNYMPWGPLSDDGLIWFAKSHGYTEPAIKSMDNKQEGGQ